MMWLRFSRNENDISQQHLAAIRQVTDKLQYGRNREELERKGPGSQRVHKVGSQDKEQCRDSRKGHES